MPQKKKYPSGNTAMMRERAARRAVAPAASTNPTAATSTPTYVPDRKSGT